ncbi:galactose-proton symport [Purpureocillium lavendulum]|uniref:Galactose-proton symport n=1 Tax=Purpureocillium lavendulum TaxID=1247861 RepID=A0AB34FT23_9HYPO|nr:galactose-proton symport [Purpureocillium lavendulum]
MAAGEFTAFWEQPSHPELIQVVKGTRPYAAAAYSLVALPAGAHFARITTATPVPQTTYTSVGTGRDARVELNSDLVYCNHSCAPSLVFDMARREVRVADGRPLRRGDPLTFFYPSSEWDMVQPFRCECGEGVQVCLGVVAGASNIDPLVLSRYWLNDHVRELLAEKMGAESTQQEREKQQVGSAGLTAPARTGGERVVEEQVAV